LSQTDEVVVIKGVRRCGKSTLLVNEMKRLVASGVAKERLLFINFEDVRLIGHLGVELLGLIGRGSSENTKLLQSIKHF
jgi:predicted AAA+ superfamily ATPase